MARTKRKGGISLAKGPVGLIGLASLAFGVLGLIFGGQSFTSSPVDGTVNGESFLGVEGNGWTWVLFIAAGALLLFAAPLHWGAKTMALLVGLALGAASVIALFDGEDVFGIFAANGLTKLILGATSAALLILSLLPRIGGKRVDRDERMAERPARTAGEERIVERERQPVVDRETVVDREPAGGRFSREPAGTRDRELVGERPAGRREVVAPADGDGPADHGRNR